MTRIPSDISKLLGDEKIRFVVIDGEGQQRSSDWIIWESAGSLYISVTALSSATKLSFHPRNTSNDGKDSQFSVTRNVYDKLISNGHTEPLPYHRWKRPMPLDGEISHIASITFPTAYLGDVVIGKPSSAKKLAFPMAEEGRAIELGLFSHYTASRSVLVSCIKNGSTPVCDFELAKGEHIFVMARYIDFQHKPETHVPAMRLETLWFGKPIHAAGKVEHARAITTTDSYPKDGEVLHLAEIGNLTISRLGH